MALSSCTRAFQLLLALCLLMGGRSGLTPPASGQNCSHRAARPRTFSIMMKCNLTVLPDKHKTEIQAPTTGLVVPLMYLGALLLGLPANALALWVLVFHTQRLPSTALLINLTLMDLLVLLALPLRMAYHFAGNNWVFGEPLCRLVTALLYGTMYGSVLCLALVSVDRYVALVHPFGARTLRSHGTSLILSLAAWAVVLVTMLPLLLTRQSYKLTDPPIVTCHDALPVGQQATFFFPYFASVFCLGFMLPLLVILFCHGTVLYTLLASGRHYAHAACLTLLVLLVFIACFLPCNTLLMLHYSDIYLTGDEKNLYVPYMVSLAVSCFGPSFDPFIYYFVSEDFRAKLLRVLCCRDPGSLGSSSNQVTYSSANGQSRSTLLSRSCGHNVAV